MVVNLQCGEINQEKARKQSEDTKNQGRKGKACRNGDQILISFEVILRFVEIKINNKSLAE